MRVLWPEPFVSDTLARFRHTLATGDTYHAPSTVEQRADSGHTEAYDWKLERVTLPDGRPGVVCHFYDLSERQRHEAELQAAESRHRALLEATGAVTWTCDALGRQVSVQRSWLVFTGQSAEDAADEGWTSAVHPDDLAGVATRWRTAVANGVTCTSEHRLRRHDGAWRWMQATVAPVRDAHGRLVEWFGAAIDITDRRRAEDELRQADRRKSEFVAILAHELRNPLAPIRTALALQATRELHDPILLKSRDVIDRQVSHMARLLDDLLDVSRLSRGALTLTRSDVALADVLTAAVEMATPLLIGRRQTLTLERIDGAPLLHADPDRLVQVFGNLLTNASKFSPDEARITVAGRVDGEMVAVEVRDTGLGVAPEHLDALFDLFAQLDRGGQSGADGLGIGLAMVKRLVELHGGTVAAASDGLGCGSTFTVRLPVVRGRAATPSPPQVTSSSSPMRRRVLVADDHIDSADTIALLLTELGCDVQTVYGGEQALRTAESFLPEVVLLDLGMPDLDGQEVCRRLRSQPWGAGMMVVALTGWGRDDDRHRTRLAGFDQHLTKPAHPEALLRLMQDPPRDHRP
jgi:PAS domain S-box-containing protein